MIHNFQVLRALAAMLVVFVHVEILARPLGLTESDLRFGNVGVDLFFVLSGFVIVHSVMRRDQGAREFARNRIIRVVPLYWVLTLGVFAVALVAPALLNSTQADWADLARSLAFIPFRKDNGLIHPVLFVGWTLNYEMFFYLVFASALALVGGIARRAAPLASAAMLLFVGWVQWTQPDSLVLRFFGDTIVIEFLLGMWIALLTRRGIPIAAPVAATMLAVAGGWLIVSMAVIPEGPRWIYSGLPAAVVLISALALEERGRALTHPKLQLLGAASYALYLSHPFVLQAIGKLFAPFNSAWFAVPAILFSIVVALIVGVLLHLWLEKPMTEVLKRRWNRGSRRGMPINTPTGTP